MKNHYKYILLCSLCFSTLACNSKTKSQARAAVPAADSIAQIPAADADKDEKQFHTFFDAFRQAVKQNSKAGLENMLHFPLQTSPKWADEDLKNMDVDKNAGKVSRQEFNQYYKNIFTADVQRMLPKAVEEHLSEIGESNSEDYYRTLRQDIDPHTKMYEVYMQFPEPNTNAETYFAFVCGKVKGKYKIISYYAKWPVKD
ncbi:hypothetical protein AAHN97_15425 [Chitinophaga niabensis]|uniref:hypothetical protein n=1 Tax=Chitinophaga niabensis TaxID=536979 RepID=UPI0031BAC514